MSDDSWKGEHLIRGLRLSKEDSKSVAVKVGTAQFNRKRARQREPHPAQAEKDKFCALVFKSTRGKKKPDGN